MDDADEAYVIGLTDSFQRYIAGVVRPLLSQNRDLKAALNAERKRNADLTAQLERHA